MGNKAESEASRGQEPAGCVLALYGAQGALGEQILVGIEGEGLPIDRLIPVGAGESLAKTVSFRGASCKVAGEAEVDLADVDVAVVATGGESARAILERLESRGVFVLDASGEAPSGTFPLRWNHVELNFDEDPGARFPAGVTSTIAPVLERFSGLGRIVSVDVVALLSASCAGRAGSASLSKQTLDLLNYRIPDGVQLGGVLAFNVLPGAYPTTNFRGETIGRELRELVPALAEATFYTQCARIPVFTGIACAVHITFEKAIQMFGPEAFAKSREIDVSTGDVGLRDTIDSELVLVTDLQHPEPNKLGVFCLADPIQRTAGAIVRALGAFISKGL